MVIERMICLSNGSGTLPVEVRQNDYNAAEIRLLVYETPDTLLDMTDMAPVVTYQKDGVPSDPYEATVEDLHYLRFTFPASVAEEVGKGMMQIALYAQDALMHSYTLPFVVEWSIPMPQPGTTADPAPAFFSLLKEAKEVLSDAEQLPYINDANTWMVWDKENNLYIDTSKLATPLLTFEAETGEPGTNVVIEHSGTLERPVIKLTIPRGEKGVTDGVDYSDEPPMPLVLEASPGTKSSVARSDHAHPRPNGAELAGVVPIEKGGTGAETVEKARANLGAVAMSTVTVTLLAEGWSDNMQTIEVPGVTASNIIITSPVYTSQYAYNLAGVGASAQADGTLTFTAQKTPTAALSVNILIIE